mgnify:CR=1 FL=1
MCGLLGAFRPGMCVDGLKDIDLDDLRSRGIRALMLDLDNTILPWQDTAVPESSDRWVRRAKSLGFGVCIVSNTHNPKRLTRIASALGIPSVHRALKPRRRGFEQALRTVGCDPAAAAVVGDQILTDIVGGNLAGMFTILVRPMHPREFIGTKLSRIVERLVLAVLRRADRVGTNTCCDQSEDQDSR